MKFLTRIEKSKTFWFLFISTVAFFFLRLPSLFEPYWYGDEGIYQALGMLMNSGQPLYSGAWDNKPPLLYVVYAIFNSDQFLTRFSSLIIGVFSIWAFYYLSKKLFPAGKISKIITVIYLSLFGIRLLEGNIANAENFMLFPIILSGLVVFQTKTNDKLHKLLYFSAGLMLGIAFLFKIVAVFDFLAFFSFLFISFGVNSFEKIKQVILKSLIPISLGFAMPIILAFIYYFLTNNFKDYFSALLFSNVGYVGYGNKFIIPQGFLILKSVILFVFTFVLYIKRDLIPKNILFILTWLAFSLFNAAFSQRPYTHYLLVLLPSFCLLLGLVFSEKKKAILGFSSLAIVLLFVANTFNLKGRLLDYYVNFASFTFGKKSLYDYQSFFDKNTPRDYRLAGYIKANTTQDDQILLWGNNAQVYKLSGKVPISRYVVAYHITNFKGAILEMDQAIKTKKPKLIILMPNTSTFPLSLSEYSEKIDIQNAKIYERIL